MRTTRQLQKCGRLVVWLAALAISSNQSKNTVLSQPLPTTQNPGSSRPELALQVSDAKRVNSLAFSPDGNTLASGSGDNTVRLWDARTGELKQTLRGHTSAVSSVAFSPDGKTLASGSYDRTVRLWDVQKEGLLRTLTEHRGHVYAVAFSPDGKMIASGCQDNTVRLWDAQTGTLLRTLTGHAHHVHALALSPDGKTLASGSEDRTVRLWDVQTGTFLRPLTGHSGLVWSVAFSPDGKTLASGSLDKTVILWDVQTGELKQTLPGHSRTVYAVAFSPDGKMVASGSEDNTMRLWDAQKGTLLRTLTGRIHHVHAIAFSPGGKVVASGSDSNIVSLWEASSQRLLATLLPLSSSEKEDVSTTDWIAFTPEGYYDSSAGAGRYVRWKVGNDLFPVEAYERTLHRPDLVQKALRTESLPPAPEVQRFIAGRAIPPQVAFITPSNGQEVTDESLNVELTATDDKKVTEIKLVVNGQPIGAKPIEVSSKPIEVTSKPIPTSHKMESIFRAIVPLPSGEANITLQAVAYDEEGLQGRTEITRLTHRITTPVLGDLYVLSVGISQYRNPKLNLKYAARDAEAFADLWKRTEGTLYRRVIIKRLTDAQATAANMRAALRTLTETATERDKVLIFLKGHGVLPPPQKDRGDGREEYYFATHETDLANLSATALPWTVFQDTLSQRKANRVLLFLDACHAGNSLSEQQANNERLAESLVRQAGVMVFASSLRSQFSYELDDRQHGAFAAALIEGIGEGKADLGIGGKGDGVMTVEELDTYLRARVPQLTGNLQTPTCPLRQDFGEPFPLIRTK